MRGLIFVTLLALGMLVLSCDFTGPRVDPLEYPIIISANGDDLERGNERFVRLYAVSLEGETRLLAHGEYGDRYPVFNPQGTRIAFETSREGVTSESVGIYLALPNARNARPLSVVGGDGPFRDLVVTGRGPVAWSPVGSSVVFTGIKMCGSVRTLVLATVDGSYDCLFQGGSENVSPSWSPDGGSLAYASDVETAHPGQGRLDIFVHDLDLGSSVRVTFWDELAAFPAWSPDGKYLAYQLLGARGKATEDAGIWIINVDQGESRKVEFDVGNEIHPKGPLRWLPGSKHFLFAGISANRDVETLFVYCLETGTSRAIVDVRNIAGFDWNPAVEPVGL